MQFVGHKSWCSLVNVKDKWRVSLVGQQNQLLKKGKCLKGNSKPMGFFCKNTKSRPNMLMSQLCACRYDWIWQNRKINKLWTHFNPIFVVVFFKGCEITSGKKILLKMHCYNAKNVLVFIIFVHISILLWEQINAVDMEMTSMSQLWLRIFTSQANRRVTQLFVYNGSQSLLNKINMHFHSRFLLWNCFLINVKFCHK